MLRQAFLALSDSSVLRKTVAGSGLGWRGARRFVAGETIEDAMVVVSDLNAAGLAVTLDHLGEHVTKGGEAAQARRAYLEGLRHIDDRGARAGISLKLTALGLDLGVDVALEHLTAILEQAGKYEPPVFVTIDMESSAYTDRTLDLFEQVRAEYLHVGTVIQSYLYRSDADIERLIAHGATVRLVKGAYLEPPDLAYPEKDDVDAAFLRQTQRLLSEEARAAGVEAQIATHDEAIIEWTKRHAATESVPKDVFEFQMLYGIRRDLQEALVAEGYRVRTYVPYGTEWYPYFMRRLAERPENVAFILRSMATEARR